MASIFCDSFDFYATTGSNKGPVLANGRYLSSSTANEFRTGGTPAGLQPRTGTTCLQLGNPGGSLTYLTPGTQATLIVGFAFAINGSAAEHNFMIASYNNGGVTDHLKIYRTTDNAIRVDHGDSTVLGTSASSVINTSSSAWNFIEIKATIHDTTGSVDVYIDGDSVLSLSNVDTRNGSSAIWNQVKWIDGGGDIFLDDIYINDTTGSDNNDVLGEIKVYTLDVDGAGSAAQFAPSAGSNYENVDEVVIDDDTTYNSDSVSGQKDLFTIENLPANVTVVHFVENVTYARREEGGSAQLKLKTELSSSEQDSGAKTFGTTYSFESQTFDTDPDSAAWTPTKVDDSEIGYEVV